MVVCQYTTYNLSADNATPTQEILDSLEHIDISHEKTHLIATDSPYMNSHGSTTNKSKSIRTLHQNYYGTYAAGKMMVRNYGKNTSFKEDQRSHAWILSISIIEHITQIFSADRKLQGKAALAVLANMVLKVTKRNKYDHKIHWI
jgi:hypothetical protein